MSLEDHAKLGSEVAPNFKPENVDGLIGKTFIGNVDAGVFGGVYYFSSPESVDAYLDSELWKGVVAHPNLVNFTTDVYGVASISEVSNGLSSNRSTSSEASDAEGMMVLVVNYELQDMSLEDHAKLGSEVAPNFKPENVDGLIGKTFIGNVDAGVFGGVYYFSSPESVDAYLDSELWKGVVAHPNLVNFTTDVYGVASISEVSNGLSSNRSTSSEASDAEGMMVLVVNYELQDMSLEDHAKLGSEVAPNFKPENVDGLIGKTFIGNVDAGVFGGVYYFSSPESVDAYLDSELWKGVVAHPNLVNFTTDVYGVAPITISNGIPVL
jgi:YHS domain-containing protein/nitrate reductase NapAB chaperone NapD